MAAMHLSHCCPEQLLCIAAMVALLCQLGLSAAIHQEETTDNQSEASPSPAPNCMLQWLEGIGIDQASAQSYSSIFKNQSIDEQVLKLLTIQQLGDVGISKYGHKALMYSCSRQAGGGDCNPSSCGQGGSCHLISADNHFQCVCRSGFEGEFCEHVVDECAAYPCLNGGTCGVNNGSSVCQCPSKFTGDRCQYDYCHTQPCQNGGTCTGHTSGYNCSCPRGYEGRHCETAWFSPEDYTSLKEDFAQLSSELTSLQKDVADNKLESINDSIDVVDRVLSAQGPRFFKEWLEVEHGRTLQVKQFNMDSRQFLGVVNTNARHERYGILVYEIVNNSLVHIQTLRLQSPESIKPFHIGRSQGPTEYFIATANSYFYDEDYQNIPSALFKWNGSKFVKVQDFFKPTGAMDVDFVTIANLGSFLAFSCHHDTRSHDTPSIVYIWDAVSGVFVYYQTLPTTGAQKLHFFSVREETFLAVAIEFDRTGNGLTDSMLFRWNGTHFDQRVFQYIPTQGARDLHPFVIGCHVFLVAANFFDGTSHNIMSKVYRLENGSFIEHAAIQTRGATAVEPFTIRSEHFLTVINSHDEVSGSSVTASVIYRIDGPSFVPFQEIVTEKGSYAYFFSLRDDCKALAISNEAAKSKLYKWTFVSLKNACCM